MRIYFQSGQALKHRRLLSAGTALFAGAVAGSAPARAQSWNLYGNYTSLPTIPFAGGPMGTNNGASVYLSMTGSNPTQFVMDTGSTGILVSPDNFKPGPNDVAVGTGSQFYSSSGLLSTGTFYETNVVINQTPAPGGLPTPLATSKVTVLLVTNQTCIIPGRTCTPTPPGGTPTGIAYMGVGFDRGASSINPPAPNNNTNPFINIVSIAPGVNASMNTLRQGYLITNSGVTLGLSNTTDINNNNPGTNFAFVKLTPNTPNSGQPSPAWQQAPMTITVGGTTGSGQILPDAGIGYSFLTPPPGATLATSPCPNPPGGGSCITPSSGAQVQVFLPGQSTLQPANYSYTLTSGASSNPLNPNNTVEVIPNGPAIFLNTGRQFFQGFDYLYDPIGGFVGYAWANAAGAIGQGQVTPSLALIGDVSLQNGFSNGLPTFLMDNTTLSQSGTGTFLGVISGPGGLTKNGLGTLILSGANSYTGGTVVNQGILQLAPGASLPTSGALAVNGGTLDLNGNNLAIGSLSGLGGRIELGSSSTLTVAEQGNTSFAGILAGTGGLTMQGPGVLSLAGANTYTGPTNVNGGRLAVNGSITSDVTVGAGGNLGGIGTITGTVTNAGIFSPGNSIGTLNVVGSLTQAAGGSFQVETNSAGQADRVNVSGAPGTTTIAGGTVTLTGATGVYAPSTTYTILNATGGVAGTFANANSLFPFLQPSLSYDANNVFLTLKPGGFGAGAATANQAAVGRVLDASVAGSSGDLATVIGTMATYTLGQGQAAMNAISGQNYSGFGTANLGGGLLFMNSLGQQMGLARGGFGSGTRVALAQACETGLADAEACDGAASPWSLWGSALGGTGRVAGTANAGTLTYNAGGFATGVDYRFDPRFLAGIGVGFSSGNQWASGFSGQGTTSSYQASLYASFTQGAFYLDGMAGYGYSDNWMTRQIALPNLAVRTAQGRTGANQFLGQVEAGYRIGLHEPAALSFTPFARFQGITNSQYGFSESGAGALSLTVAPQTTGSARSVLGAEFAGAFGPEGREKLAVQMRLGWAHEYADTARPVTASFAGAPGANFTVFGAAPQRDTATLSLAANTAVARGVSLYARYDGEVGNGISSHALNGGLRLSW